MKILLSAYACEPNKGSEPGVGWHWAIELSRLGHQVWVVTRRNNKAVIETALAEVAAASNLRFVYYDLPVAIRWWKRGNRGIHIYYFIWQWGAYRAARRVHAKEGFDWVHHVTLGSIRQPSFMGRLGVPFIFGPVGGGEKAPGSLRRSYHLRGWIVDAIRDLANCVVRIDPLMYETFLRAERIYVKTFQSRSVIPKQFWFKVQCRLEIGIDIENPPRVLAAHKGRAGLRVLYVGRFLYWKGMHLGLQAFARLLRADPSSYLTLVGNGPEKARWKFLAENLHISNQLIWEPWVKQDDLRALYDHHDVLLFPSLHDSSGNVVLEALSRGLPVICLDLGGPGTIVDDTCGRVIPTSAATESDVVRGLAEALIEMAESTYLLKELAVGALDKARQNTWEATIGSFYSSFSSSSTPSATN